MAMSPATTSPASVTSCFRKFSLLPQGWTRLCFHSGADDGLVGLGFVWFSSAIAACPVIAYMCYRFRPTMHALSASDTIYKCFHFLAIGLEVSGSKDYSAWSAPLVGLAFFL